MNVHPKSRPIPAGQILNLDVPSLYLMYTVTRLIPNGSSSHIFMSLCRPHY